MNYLKRLKNYFIKNKLQKEITPPVTQGYKDFMEGRSNVLTSADIDPVGAQLYSNFLKAMQLKKEGDLLEAEKLLIKSCEPPSLYHGHYRELFKIWRQFNREDIKDKNYNNVSNRVIKMVKLENEMIEEMLRYWSIQQKRKLPEDHFNSYRKILISDAKALKKAAIELENIESLALANSILDRFIKTNSHKNIK